MAAMLLHRALHLRRVLPFHPRPPPFRLHHHHGLHPAEHRRHPHRPLLRREPPPWAWIGRRGDPAGEIPPVRGMTPPPRPSTWPPRPSSGSHLQHRPGLLGLISNAVPGSAAAAFVRGLSHGCPHRADLVLI
ncbi:hypothetical protein BRADI_3g17353v3 [Brachypodium distachyon]|uniref:Uncharacterized protein n=1 Tax=Brachypodium distachyon TaxID=15368 RepID=A0A0Q3F7S4_BRADI|nr:hypothetical protein BRADI_3g17353v3 [Brachypodium distachyon]